MEKLFLLYTKNEMLARYSLGQHMYGRNQNLVRIAFVYRALILSGKLLYEHCDGKKAILAQDFLHLRMFGCFDSIYNRKILIKLCRIRLQFLLIYAMIHMAQL